MSYGYKKKISLDFETRSEKNLTDVGAAKYAESHSTEIICLSVKRHGEKPKVWVPIAEHLSTISLNEVIEIILDNEYLLCAHNAFFEQMIIKYVLSRDPRSPIFCMVRKRLSLLKSLSPSRFSCTAAKAAAVALPRKLEHAAKVLSLSRQKDMKGNRLIKKWMKPRPAWTKWALTRIGPEPKKWYDDEFELWDIIDYCNTDTIVEELLDDKLPDLTPTERGYWLINQQMNARGVSIDLPLVNKVIGHLEHETKNLERELFKTTDGEVSTVGQTSKLLMWCHNANLKIENMQAKTINDFLASKIDEKEKTARRVLEIRQLASKSSNKKYYAFRDRAGSDGRVRDLALYHGASTGRETGTGIQVHNMPKGKIKNFKLLNELLKNEELDFIKFIYKNPFEAFSSGARSAIIATPGYEIFSADLNAIECRVLNWISGNHDVLDDFRNGRDPYVKMANRIFNYDISKAPSEQFGGLRFLGKTVELACGYQMGPDRFYQTCVEWGVPNVTQELAKKSVEIYRSTHQPVVRAWALIEKAAIAAVQKNIKVSVCKTSWYVKDNFLWCVLPSGRRLAFYKPTVRMENTPWGEPMPKLYHWSVHSKTKQWTNSATYGGKLVENVCQAIARDITMSGIQNVHLNNYHYIFQVHDEINSERKVKHGSLDEYIKLMTKNPKWALDLPIAANGWVGSFYRKD